jgi:hypothetical protein
MQLRRRRRFPSLENESFPFCRISDVIFFYISMACWRFERPLKLTFFLTAHRGAQSERNIFVKNCRTSRPAETTFRLLARKIMESVWVCWGRTNQVLGSGTSVWFCQIRSPLLPAVKEEHLPVHLLLIFAASVINWRRNYLCDLSKWIGSKP